MTCFRWSESVKPGAITGIFAYTAARLTPSPPLALSPSKGSPQGPRLTPSPTRSP